MLFNSNKKGSALITVLVFTSIAVIIISGLVGWFSILLRASSNLINREQAFHAAEAGVDYYRWHLAHAGSDYKDGTTSNGPYVHDFLDKDGNKIGTYSLEITPPTTGTNIVTITSTGRVLADPTIVRKVRARLAMPSLAKFAVVANDELRFGVGTEVYGPLLSNEGIHFDGLAHNIVTSAKTTYDDPDHADTSVEYGVHTHVNVPPATGVDNTYRANEAPPITMSNRNDVFVAGRQTGVPSFDFSGMVYDISTMKTKAQADGKYLGDSGGFGYHIVLKTTDKYDLYKVNAQKTVNGACRNKNDKTVGWATWSIGTQTLISSNLSFPNNGLIFAEDNIWVDGTIDTAKLTIASARLIDSQTGKNDIIINTDLKYTNHDGRDEIALIAQNNINVGLYSEDNLEIDAALITQNGRFGRYYYNNSQCEGYDNRDTVTMYGMIATNQRYGLSYLDINGTKVSGYTVRNINYDANLMYNPPPYMPLASDYYQIISWEDIQ